MPAIVEEEKTVASGKEKLLQRIRDRYKYAKDYWQEIRDERQIDMRYISGDPWDEKDRRAREDAGRPCINHDELTQFINQAVNQIRQSPPGVIFKPGDESTDDKTAEFETQAMRGIEFRSQAQDAYCVAYQNAVEGSYGFIRVNRKYVSKKKFDQDIVIKAILNPDSVLYDPDCKEPDWSDARFVFVLDPIPTEVFKQRYPNAEKVDFTEEDRRVAKDWLQDKQILTAEYWEAESSTEKLIVGDHVREIETRKITQYITNGVEILKKKEEIGEIIPIIAVIGKEMYVDDGNGPKRKLVSLVRLARDPQMSLAYLNSLEMEEAGLTPKVPYVGYKGQFESDAEAWEDITKVPRAFVQADAVTDQSGNLLPLPKREQFTPNFQVYEIAKDSCRRAIQAAMGQTPLPTAAQRQNEKSGVALEKIQNQQAVGTFHFTANLYRSLRLIGKIVDTWMPKVYDTERRLSLRKPDDSHRLVYINKPYTDEKTGEEFNYNPPEMGDHEVTISVAPSNESTRQAASDFLDALISNLGKLPLAPPQSAKLLAMAIQMKQLGPKGDQMAEIISPPDPNDLPPAAQAALAQMQGNMQVLQQQLAELTQEKEAKLQEGQWKMAVEQMKAASDQRLQQMENEVRVLIAEIQTKAQKESERDALFVDLFKHLQTLVSQHEQSADDKAHERGMAAVNQSHERDMADRQAVIASQQSAQDAQQQAAQAQNSAEE